MNAITDEVANLVQHVKDVVGKIGHLLSGQASTELDKIHEQAQGLHDLIAQDLHEDTADVAADVRQDEEAAQSSLSAGSTPAAPVTPGVPTTSIPGTETGAASSTESASQS